VIGEAAWRKRLSLDATRGALERANGRRNLHALEEAIERYERGEKGLKSRAELAFLRLVGEPRPLSNAHVEGEEVDAHRPERKLIVEVRATARERWSTVGRRAAPTARSTSCCGTRRSTSPRRAATHCWTAP